MSLNSILKQIKSAKNIGLVYSSFDLYNCYYYYHLDQLKSECDVLLNIVTNERKGKSSNSKSNTTRFHSLKERRNIFNQLTGINVLYESEFFKLVDEIKQLNLEKIKIFNHVSDLPKFIKLLNVTYDPYKNINVQKLNLLTVNRVQANSQTGEDSYNNIELKSDKIIKDEDQFLKTIDNLKLKNKIVTTNGSFDLLHQGHINYLLEAKKSGDKLIVLVNDNRSIKKAKGDLRPYYNQLERMYALSGFEFIDYVIPFYGDNPLYLLEKIKPKFHIKGGSFEQNRIEKEKNLIENNGGQFLTLDIISGFSSSSIESDILNS